MQAGRGPGHDIGRCCATVGVSATCRPLCTFNLDYELLTNLTSVCSQVSSEQHSPPESCVLLSTAQELARVLRPGAPEAISVRGRGCLVVSFASALPSSPHDASP